MTHHEARGGTAEEPVWELASGIGCGDWRRGLASVLVAAAVLAAGFAPVHAQDLETAKYDIRFTGLWDSDALADGIAVPDGGHFKGAVVGVHNAGVTFWAVGQRASAGLETLAETGAAGGFRAEMDAEKPDDVYGTVLLPSIINATQTKRVPFKATREHSRVTVAAMIAPSPDWFVGVTGLNLREDGAWRKTFSVDLYPYDAGTEQGTGFSTDNPDDNGNITSIRNTGKFSDNPIARLTFTLREPPRVKGVEVTPADGELEVSWNEVDVAAGYKVQWRSGQQTFGNAAEDGREAKVSGGSTTGYTIAGLTNGTEYTVRVVATNPQGDGRASVEVKATPVDGGTSMVVSDGVSITSNPGGNGEYVVGDDIEITVAFSRSVTVTGTPQIGIALDAERTADYVASKSTATALVFAYTVTSADYDQNGAGVPADGLSLNGGTINDAVSGNAALLSFPAVAEASRHRVLRMPVAVQSSARLVSTPASGFSYITGETITVEVAFDRNVQVYSPAPTEHLSGIPSYALVFGVPGNATLHHAAYARIVGGRKVQFDYVVQAGDYDPNGILGMDPAVHGNGGTIVRAEMDAGILSDGIGDDRRQKSETAAKVGGTNLPQQPDHKVNASSTEVTLSVDRASVAEDEGTTTVTVTGTLDGTTRSSDLAVTVSVGDASDEAVEGTDYGTVGSVMLTIAAGSTSGTATFDLAPTDDDLDEEDEFVSIAGTTTAAGVTVVETELTITDNDTRGVTVSKTSLTVAEGGTGNYTVVLASEPTDTVTVTPAVSGSSDVTVDPALLTFAPAQWNTRQTVTVSMADDGASGTDGYAARVSHAVAGADYGANQVTAAAVRVNRNGEPGPLTAEFGAVPASHTGAPFTFDLTFSEDVGGLSYKTLRDAAFDVTGGRVTKAKRQTQGSNKSWTITVKPASATATVKITLPKTTDCSATGAICTPDGRKLSNAPTARVDPAASASASDRSGRSPVAEGDPMSDALALAEGLSPDDAAAALFGEQNLGEDRLAALDRLGNGNGSYDLGDLLSWIHRCRRGEANCGNTSTDSGPAARAALPAAARGGGTSRRTGGRAPAPRGRSPVRRARRRRGTAPYGLPMLLAAAVTWSCTDDAVGPTAAAEPDPGFLTVELAAPAASSDIGVLLELEGPGIETVRAAGYELYESGAAGLHQIVVAGSLRSGPLVQFDVPDRNRLFLYRVRVVQVTGGDYGLRDPTEYRAVIRSH